MFVLNSEIAFDNSQVLSDDFFNTSKLAIETVSPDEECLQKPLQETPSWTVKQYKDFIKTWRKSRVATHTNSIKYSNLGSIPHGAAV